ncbi:hypothetical protein ASPWEDRAFT_119639 [Aspergillus wentii DTO 134E9]|uniref:Uncharacterized protein n=1 Tax=Aspergillus wentii DTO 134E9 TaxID=1073089 RepID=A0A1L9R854_ASPWE|nr:uncharacterized protein ASPWEDRAFT_119639 [Aspergillus wentii DTO 134E9]KAI9924940.1 hypothetical protein MW887_006347 [Aspergillus wentii]OJJ31105.1 hypothetical protein ASPWEDRAFT_119639 [Aspergillus wentii DTO 134E9]
MCIALISTAHPSYPLIIIDNRDEYLRRPTSSVDWWEAPNSHVLGSRDLARATQGTWMGVTKDGKVAVLTNYRETASDQAQGVQSRGTIVNSWLTLAPDHKRTTRDFAHDMIENSMIQKVGGFSLVCGHVNEPLAIISNRSKDIDHISWVATEKNQTLGLSNTCFDDRSWPKIINGEKLTKEAIDAHVLAGEDEDGLINRLLEVLNTDTLPRLPEDAPTESYIHLFRNSIFIPVIGSQDETKKTADEVEAACLEDKVTDGTSKLTPGIDPSYTQGAYGTQKQTVILVSEGGRVRYFERTLYDNDVNAIPIGKGDRSIEFTVGQ